MRTFITCSPALLWSMLTLPLLANCKGSQQTASKRPPSAAQADSPATPRTPTKGEAYVQTALVPLDSDDDGSWDLLAVDWTIKAGWHIYWTNPGESGLASKVKLDSESVKHLRPVRLPAPEKFFSAGDVVGHGYHDQTTFFAKRSDPSRKLDSPIQAKLTWLVCKDSCLRGSKTLTLDPAQVPKAWSSAQRKAFARLPKPAQDLSTEVAWTGAPNAGKTASIQAKPGAIVEFFPLESRAELLSSKLDAGKLGLTYKSPAALDSGESALGVVGIKTDGAVTYYNLALAAP